MKLAARTVAALARGLCYAVLCLSLLAALAVVVVPQMLGVHFATILSDSMRPSLARGDMIIARSVNPQGIRVGDVILFRSPTGSGGTIAHRVVEVVGSDDTHAFVTKGDANEVEDRWVVSASHVVGKVQFHVPLLGYITHGMRKPQVFVLAIGVPGVLIIASEAWSIMGALRRKKAGDLGAGLERGS